MKIENVKIYDLEESIIASGYPLQVNISEDGDYEIEKTSIDYWTKQHILEIDNIIVNGNHTSTKYEYNDEENCVNMYVNNHINPIKIDYEDVLFVSQKGWSYNNSRGYIQSTNHRNEEKYIELQNYLMGDKDSILVVDHINRDKFDNRRSNLRFVTRSQNSHNRDKLDSNTSGVTGVFWSNSKNRWIASIGVNGKKITRSFKNKEEAIKKRLQFEADFLKEYAPQKDLFEQYGIVLPEEHKYEYPIEHFEFKKVLRHLKRCHNLSKACDHGNGAHGQFLTGIRVAFDLTFSNKMSVELERYRFLEFVSSQSTMHRITKFDLNESYNEYVDSRVIEIMKEKVDKYNELSAKMAKSGEDLVLRALLERQYLEILYTNPSGFELTARLTTNYRCLKNIYIQRKNHRLPEWRQFCEWIETLPLFETLINTNTSEESN